MAGIVRNHLITFLVHSTWIRSRLALLTIHRPPSSAKDEVIRILTASSTPVGSPDQRAAFLPVRLLSADSEHGITLKSYDANFLHKIKLRECPPPSTELTLGLAYAEGCAMIVSGTFLLSYCLISTLTGLNVGKLQVIKQINTAYKISAQESEDQNCVRPFKLSW